MLDVLEGGVERIAESETEFQTLINERAWQETYLLSEVVYDLHEVGMVPSAKQCYAIVPHPAVGGPNPYSERAINPSSMMLMDVSAWQIVCSQLLCGVAPG